MSLPGFQDIPISSASVRRLTESLEHATQALQALPAVTVSDDPLMRNYADVINQTRGDLQRAEGVLQHLLQRAAQCH